MYFRLPAGALAALAGLTAVPGASPALRGARVLLAVAGLGFGLYLLGAAALLVQRRRVRRPGGTRT